MSGPATGAGSRAAGAALVAVIVVAVGVPAALVGDESEDRVLPAAPSGERSADRPDLDPYVGSCPVSGAPTLAARLPDLAAATSVQMCLRGRGQPPFDALVTDLDRFADSVADIERHDDEWCQEVRGPTLTPFVLAVTVGSGARFAVPAPSAPCATARAPWTARHWRARFFTALEDQRDGYRYDANLTEPVLGCRETPPTHRSGRAGTPSARRRRARVHRHEQPSSRFAAPHSTH